MKKKIAVFTNGWNDDYLDFALEGIRRRAAEDNIDAITNYNIIIRIRSVYLEIRLDIRKTLMYFFL